MLVVLNKFQKFLDTDDIFIVKVVVCVPIDIYLNYV